MKYKIKNHIIDAKSPVEALKIHKLLDSVKDAEPTYRSVWLKVKEYVKSHYNFKYSRDFSGLMNWLNTQYGGILDEDEVYKILRDLNSKGYVMFITDSVKDSYLLQLKNDRDVYWQEDDHFGRSKNYAKRFDTYEEAKTKADAAVSNWRDVIDIIKDSVRDNYTKDEAYDRSTIEALISDEKAAIDAYNVAIANLKGKIPEESIKVLQAIRDDELRHSENLNAILAGNVTEKNLEDSAIKDDIVNEIPSALDTAKQYAKNANYQVVANICWDIATRLKRMKLADANDLNTADKIIMATEIVRKVMSGAGPRDYGGTIGYKVYPNEISRVIDLLKHQFPNIKVKKHVNGISGEIEILKNSLN